MIDSEVYFWAAFAVLWVVVLSYVTFLVMRKSQLKKTLAVMKRHLKESEKR